MNALLSVPVIVDAVIVVTLAEFAVLLAWHKRVGAGVAPRDFALNMVSGLCLMLALRCAVRGSSAAWILALLLCAGLAHGADILRRWRRP